MFKDYIRLFIFIKLRIGCLIRFHKYTMSIKIFRVSKLNSNIIKIFITNNFPNSSRLYQFHSILNTIDYHSISNCNMIKKCRNQILLFHEFHIHKGLCRFLYSLTQSIFKTIWNIDNVHYFCLKSWIKHVSFVKKSGIELQFWISKVLLL